MGEEVGQALKLIINRIKEMSDEEKAKDMIFTSQDTEELFELQKEIGIYVSTIPELKKRIKYCRNPMEKKKLQRELNQAYKEQKRGCNGKR